MLSAVFAYLNERYIKFPATIGLMILGLGLSSIILLLGHFSFDIIHSATKFIKSVDFSDILLDFMLSFLLFAGALHIDWDRLHKSRWPVISFASLGVLLSAFTVGTLLYFCIDLLGASIPYIHCLLFGALISPTDPIAVLGILKKANVPKSMEIKIVGESLFNDGIGVVTFIVIYRIAQRGLEEVSINDVGIILLKEVAGGIGFGLALGYLGFRLLKSIDHYQTEVLLTLALVMGGYLLANSLGFSGPLAMATSGLLIGNEGKDKAMSTITLDYTFKFWEIVDEILNAALFVLIGLELLVVPFKWQFLWLGLISIPIAMGARYGSLALISTVMGFKNQFEPSTLSIMTWGGLRGGISIALALSIPDSMNNKLIVTITYIVVLFSIVVQGLTIEPVVKRLMRRQKG